jgi:hypothetical protein
LSRVLLTRCANCGAQLGRSRAVILPLAVCPGRNAGIELGEKGDLTDALDHYDQAPKTDIPMGKWCSQRNAALLPSNMRRPQMVIRRLRGSLSLYFFLFSRPLAATPSQPRIRVLILDGFSNHGWQLTTALLHGILEPAGLFTVSLDGSSHRRVFGTLHWLARRPVIIAIPVDFAAEAATSSRREIQIPFLCSNTQILGVV